MKISSSEATFSITRWRENFLRNILRGAAIFGLLAVISTFTTNVEPLYLAIYTGAYIALLAVIFLPLPYWLKAGTFLALFYGLGFSGLLETGIWGDSRVFFLAFITMTTLLLSPRAGVIATILSLLSALIIGVLVVTNRFEITSTDVVPGNAGTWISGAASILLLAVLIVLGLRMFLIEFAHSQMRTDEALRNLQNERDGLEERVQQRTTELISANEQTQKHAGQLRIVADMSRTILSIHNQEQLLTSITYLISTRLKHYHAGIFLLDNTNTYAILLASNSEGGQKMLARGHRLKVGEQGIVGFVTSRGDPRIALDVGQDAAFFNNPDLPDTRSELALPLKIGGVIIGALDIQSTEENAFSQEDVAVLSILADQVAIAIQNARSAEEAQRSLSEAEIATRQLSGEAWEAYAKKIQARGYRYDGVKSEALKESARSQVDADALSIPVQLRGQTIGRLKLKASDTSRHWTEDELAVIEATAERVALALDGARLLDDAQKRASRETFLSEMGAKLGASFQLDSILRDTVEELGQTLKGSTVSFQLVNPSAPPTAEASKVDGTSARRKKSE